MDDDGEIRSYASSNVALSSLALPAMTTGVNFSDVEFVARLVP